MLIDPGKPDTYVQCPSCPCVYHKTEHDCWKLSGGCESRFKTGPCRKNCKRCIGCRGERGASEFFYCATCLESYECDICGGNINEPIVRDPFEDEDEEEEMYARMEEGDDPNEPCECPFCHSLRHWGCGSGTTMDCCGN